MMNSLTYSELLNVIEDEVRAKVEDMLKYPQCYKGLVQDQKLSNVGLESIIELDRDVLMNHLSIRLKEY